MIGNVFRGCRTDVNVLLFLLIFLSISILLSNIFGPFLYSALSALIPIGVVTYYLAVSFFSGGVAFLIFNNLSEKRLWLCPFVFIVVVSLFVIFLFDYFWLMLNIGISDDISIKTVIFICFVKVLPMSMAVLVNDIGLRVSSNNK